MLFDRLCAKHELREGLQKRRRCQLSTDRVRHRRISGQQFRQQACDLAGPKRFEMRDEGGKAALRNSSASGA